MVKKAIGKIVHYYDKIGVAVVDVSAKIKVGDSIKIIGGDDEFTQTIQSMQVEHEQVKEVKKGQSIGLKIDRKVAKGYLIYPC